MIDFLERRRVVATKTFIVKMQLVLQPAISEPTESGTLATSLRMFIMFYPLLPDSQTQ